MYPSTVLPQRWCNFAYCTGLSSEEGYTVVTQNWSKRSVLLTGHSFGYILFNFIDTKLLVATFIASLLCGGHCSSEFRGKYWHFSDVHFVADNKRVSRWQLRKSSAPTTALLIRALSTGRIANQTICSIKYGVGSCGVTLLGGALTLETLIASRFACGQYICGIYLICTCFL